MTPHWEAWASRVLERFVAREHHARVPARHLEDGYRLGQWVSVQRIASRSGRLPPERIARLEALPGWDWDPLDADWEAGFSCLERFVAREHHARVPGRHLEDGYRARAVGKLQRAAYRAGQLSADRAERLDRCPAGSGNPRDADWEEGFSRLERFAAREAPHARPRGHLEDGYRLGQWVSEQRSTYRAGRLPPERIARLEACPAGCWNPLDADWEEGFSHLERFAAREHHARVPPEHLEDGYRLGRWVSKRARPYRAGRLPAERIARLEALPGWDWNPFDADWEVGLLLP